MTLTAPPPAHRALAQPAQPLAAGQCWCCCWARSRLRAAPASWPCGCGQRPEYSRVTIESDTAGGQASFS